MISVEEARRQILEGLQVTGMEIGMVRLGGFAERLFEGLFVGIRTNTEKIIERLHRYALKQPSANRRKNTPDFLSAINEPAKLIALLDTDFTCLLFRPPCAARSLNLPRRGSLSSCQESVTRRPELVRSRRHP